MGILQRKSDAHAAIRCPRCGYDQRGVIETWKDACPLRGVCTECGLEITWAEVLRPEKFEPRWCVEFTPRRRGVPLACVKTMLRSLWPWGFWSRLKMSQPIRWGRLAVYLMVLLLAPLMMYAAAQAALAVLVRRQVEDNMVQVVQMIPQQLQSLRDLASKLTAMIDGTVAPDRPVEHLQSSLARVKQRITEYQAIAVGSQYIDTSWAGTTFEAILGPLRPSSSATIISPAGSRRYVAPIDLAPFYFRSTVSRNYFGPWTNELKQVGAWFAWAVAMMFLLPASFALMPLSMRRAKVRWAHIGRVTIYSLAIPLLTLSVTAAVLWPAIFVWKGVWLAPIIVWFFNYVPWLAVAFFWCAATSRYLKIPHAWLTIGLLTFLCLLIMLGITAAISSELTWDMLDLFDPLLR